MKRRKVQVLISRSFDDAAVAATLGRLLAQAGIGTWQPPDVLYGDERGYIADQERGLREADLVLVLWSAAASRSSWVQAEIAQAVSYKRVVPVLLDDTPLPRELAMFNALDLRGWAGAGDDVRAFAVASDVAQLARGDPVSASAAAAPRRSAPRAPDAVPPVSHPGFGNVVSDLALAGRAAGKWLWRHVRGASAPPKPVLLAASAPRFCSAGTPFTAALAAYVEAAREQALQHLAELGEHRDRRLGDIAASAWRIGAPVTVRLAVDGADVDPVEVRFAWNGLENLAAFAVRATAGAPGAALALQFTVEVAGVPTVSLPMRVAIGATDGTQAQRVEAAVPRSAFASYASQDAQTVAQKLSALVRWAPGLDIFQDCLDLRPGESFKPQLEAQIDARDVFLLFWSQRAAASHWVRWELDTALRHKDADAILPMPLEDPAVAPPPPELADRHLRDRFLLAGHALSQIDRLAGRSDGH